MSRKQLVLVFGVVVLSLTAAVVLLATGGGGDETGRFVDSVGDAAVGEGQDPPTGTALADIHSTEVRREGNEIVFAARLGETLPDRLSEGNLRVRWSLSEGGGWSVIFNLDPGGRVAQIVGHESLYGGSTIDGTFPGDFQIADDTVIVRLRSDDIPDWPATLTWVTTTELVTASQPGAAAATDRAPNEGFGKLEEERR
jgi:hypothetical protein